ncbi:MAG: Gfo/Idh/MocA family oxidoreductase [Opitutaceae bacterium]|nr:Gfo/Idh/MocA family oxidoreductase [Opitutaceae bacterium]
MAKTVRLGIIGVGGMGATHARVVLAGRVAGMTLTALADSTDPATRAPEFAGIPSFPPGEEILRSGLVDAVLVATPHYAHTTAGIAALKAGLHVLVEKPISVHKADAQRLLAAHRGRSRQVFAAMFNQRTDPAFVRIRERITAGELGAIQRVAWTTTHWFRTEAYYASSRWRATWAGEGGGVLLNQCPHQLDMLIWLLGMPRRVRAFCAFGRHHAIEVEDDVTAFLEWKGGATGTFIASTGEAPGINRLEIVGDRASILFENDRVTLTRLATPAGEFARMARGPFDRPAATTVTESFPDRGGQHLAILQNFADAIRTGAPLLAPAREGLGSVELANAMLLSTWADRTIDLPIPASTYARHLQKRIRASRVVKKPAGPRVSTADLAKSFAP